ncbi:hypothetical protein TRP8649_02322 [Pelagimonas phthalicica]|uniref:Uncharacterized protein n=1 Tax=Pelagimonas phthalicica TaxID=1037362 RepID=A0A238JDH7_9RHOB|nr:hypothetical protein [Pelagimonas phthalicica]TDS91160.1 hypothetical protein CLV87_2324 [Pelagimonas phthalicica]SMX28207.1 hypothetical protein TRP8649_02322 [Pelagimonas phthalicica]
MLKFSSRAISMTILASAIALTFSIIVFLMAVVLVGEGPVIKGIACELNVSEDCLRKDLQKERQKFQQMQRRNQELQAENKKMEALVERLAALDHASSSYVVFYTKSGRRSVTTGHTYASLLKPDDLIGAHCYFFANVTGAGTRQVNLGKMDRRMRLKLSNYNPSELRGTGVSVADIAALQAQCQWPEGAS